MSRNQQSETEQFSTFYVSERLYGLDVTRVQEIVRDMPTTGIPLAPPYVRGLINLRGQVATAIGIRELFSLESTESEEVLNVVCKLDGFLISFQVDRIGDVMEAEAKYFEPTPTTIPEATRKFLSGVYKTDNQILSIIDIDKVMFFLNQQNAEQAA